MDDESLLATQVWGPLSKSLLPLGKGWAMNGLDSRSSAHGTNSGVLQLVAPSNMPTLLSLVLILGGYTGGLTRVVLYNWTPTLLRLVL